MAGALQGTIIRSTLAVTVLSIVFFNSSALAGKSVRAVGSTTVMPFVSKAAGSYKKIIPDLRITISGGGSGVGIASIINGMAEIGMASREPSPEEMAKLAGKVDIIPVAKDAVAVVVSKAVHVGGVTSLTLSQVADIYRGKITNWKELGGPDSKIVVIDKEAGRGTRHVFAKAVLGSAHARAKGATIISGSNNEEKTIISKSDRAIGMLSNGWLDDKARAVAISIDNRDVLPTIENVKNGSYPISRNLNVIVRKDASDSVKAFVQYLLSPEGQSIARAVGYLPVR